MSSNLLIYTVSYDNQFKQYPHVLKSRWKKDKSWRDFRQDLINAFKSKDNQQVQQVLSRKNFLISAYSNLLYEKKFPLVDLRGIELKNFIIQDYDLAYCCFDYAQFSHIEFNHTHLQYSTFNHAVLNHVQFNDVQASPISSVNVKFECVDFNNGFFMHSDFRGSVFLKGTPLKKNSTNSSFIVF